MIKNIRLIIFAAATATAVIFVLLHFLTTGSLKIKTQDKRASIEVMAPDGSQVATATGSLSRRLKPGRYEATVRDGAKASQVVVEVKAAHTNSYSISLAEVRPLEKISSEDAQALRVDGDTYTYYNQTEQKIRSLSSQDGPKDLFSGVSSLRWSKQVGLVTQFQGDKTTFLLEGDNLKPVQLDNPDFTSNNGQRYASSSGKDIYFYQNDSDTGKKIYSAEATGMNLFLGTNKLLIGFPENKGSENDNASQPTSKLVDLQSRQTKDIGKAVSDAAWSPNGSLLAYSASGQSAAVTDSNFNEILGLPKDSANYTWANDHELYFSLNDEVWRAESGSGILQKMVAAPQGANINSIALGPKGKIYLTATDESGSGGIYAVADPNSTDISSDIQKITPYENSHFKIEYSGLGGPTITITTYGVFNRPSDQARYEQQTKDYRSEALHFLIDRGIKLQNFKIKYAN